MKKAAIAAQAQRQALVEVSSSPFRPQEKLAKEVEVLTLEPPTQPAKPLPPPLVTLGVEGASFGPIILASRPFSLGG